MDTKARFITTAYIALAAFLLTACQNQETPEKPWAPSSGNPARFHAAVQSLTDVTVEDIFSPPLASRAYAYPCIAAYEALAPAHADRKSLAGQLNELSASPTPHPDSAYSFPLAAHVAFYQVAEKMVFSAEALLELKAPLDSAWQTEGIPKDVFQRSVSFGQAVAAHILLWAEADNYKATRSLEKYTVTETKGGWKPTPPDYMAPIEPNWRELRPFVLDSAQQFAPDFPTGFSTDKNSTFYKEMMEVYHTGNDLTEEQADIASFWDCNPYVSHHKGHLMFGTKKITPGGHWMGIARIVCEQSDADLMQTVETYALLSITLGDAFISCWDEKYRSNLIRPETVINQLVDETWRPLLQTPPFPEYTSGHSVVSASAATMLTSLYGDEFSFRDDVEVKYGLPARSFPSFLAAAEEAAISRLYGGIHYMPAISNGVLQGKALGAFLVSEIKTRS